MIRVGLHGGVRGTVLCSVLTLFCLGACSGGDQDPQTSTLSLTLSLLSSPSEGHAPLDVTLAASYFGWEPASYRWTLSDGTVIAETDVPTATYRIETSGIHTFTVVASMGVQSQSASTIVTVTEAPLTVAISPSTDSGDPPLEVSFTPQITGGVLPIASYAWDFGDGATSNEASPSHTFTRSGSFPISLTVVDAVGTEAGTGTGVDVVITVNGNSAPVATDDAAGTDEDASVEIDVIANDSDAEGHSLTVSEVESPGHGTATLDTETFTVTYTPDADFNGLDTFAYTLSDEEGANTSATVTIMVAALNDAPVALDDTALLAEDAEPSLVAVLENDEDVDGDELTIVAVDAVDGLVVEIDSAGLRITPNAGFAGEVALFYTITDPGGLSDTAELLLEVTSVNDGPTALPDSAQVDEDQLVFVDVLLNDADAEGDELSLTSLGEPEHGRTSLGEDGEVMYVPDGDYHGPDAFTYIVEDATGAETVGNVSVTVNPVNDGPIAGNDAAELDEDASVVLDLLANDGDIDGDDVEVVLVGAAEHGTLVENEAGELVYTPSRDFNGTDGFEYVIEDGSLGDTGTVTLVVAPVNDAPALDNRDALHLTPLSPASTDDLALSVGAVGADPDGDAVLFDYVWEGHPEDVEAFSVITSGTGVAEVPPLSASETQMRWSYRLRVTPNDGTALGEPFVSGIITVGNTAPVIDQVTLEVTPDPAETLDDLALTVQPTATDPDEGAMVLFNYRWQERAPDGSFVDIAGQNGAGVPTIPGLSSVHTRRDHEYRVRIEPTDGLSSGAPVYSSPITIANSLPVANVDETTTDEDTAVSITSATMLANDTDDDAEDVRRITAVSDPLHGSLTPTVVDAGSRRSRLRPRPTTAARPASAMICPMVTPTSLASCR